jgi:hypothetical protein
LLWYARGSAQDEIQNPERICSSFPISNLWFAGSSTKQRVYNAGRVIPLAVIFAAALAAAPAQARTPAPATDSQTGASRFALVTVLDPRGKPVVDVGADDFVVQEAGAAREILSVRPADYPIVLVLDTGRDARGDFEQIRKAAERFIERVGPRPVAIVTAGGTPKLIADFEDERETVMTKLADVADDPNASSATLQGAALAADLILRDHLLFSSIVILSSSTIDGSQGSPDPMLASLVDCAAILHVVANRSVQAMAGNGFRPGAAIRAVAEQSRGEYTIIYSAASFQSALDRLAERLTTEMLVEYIVPVGSKPNDVKLGVRLVGARVRGLGVAPR